LWKGERSASSDTAMASSGRADQVRVGLAVTRKWPLLGIGPGNFAVMRSQYPEFNRVSTDAQIPHSMPVLVAVEAGVPALALLALAVGAALWRRWRRSIVLAMAIAGYVAGDLMHWYTGFGMLQIGLWFGFLLLARDEVSQA
jgi:O-antigen ligase